PVQHPEQLAVIGDPSRVHSWSNGSPRADIFSVPLYKERPRHLMKEMLHRSKCRKKGPAI
ncbi:MAG TPA: hypothetical protein VJA21_06290, partial [Verrucomicrobiae bacterium]